MSSRGTDDLVVARGARVLRRARRGAPPLARGRVRGVRDVPGRVRGVRARVLVLRRRVRVAQRGAARLARVESVLTLVMERGGLWSLARRSPSAAPRVRLACEQAGRGLRGV